jgi:O-antigen ligase
VGEQIGDAIIESEHLSPASAGATHSLDPDSRKVQVLNASLAVGICLLLAFGPLAFGAVQGWPVFVLQAGAALLLLSWMVGGIALRRVEVTSSPMFVPMLLFAGLVAAQLLPNRSAYWYATWQKALLWTVYGILFFLSVQCFRRATWLKRFGIALAGFGFLVAIFAIAQKFAGNGRIYWVMPNQTGVDFFGPYPNYSHYAGLMEMLVPFPLVLAMVSFSPIPLRILYSFAAVIMGSTIFLSKSRGGVVAFVVEVGVLTVLSAVGRRPRRQVMSLGLFCLLLVVSLMLVRPHGLWDRFMQLGNPVDQAHDPNRVTILKDSLKIVGQRPLLGWGFGTFPIVYPSFRSFYTNLSVNAAHNDFVEVTVETGLLGLGLTVAFLYLLYRTGIRGTKHWRHDPQASMALAALVGCTGLVVHSFSDFNLQVPANAALFFTLAAVATVSASERSKSSRRGFALAENGREQAGERASVYRTFGMVTCLGLVAIYGWLAARSFRATRLASSLDVTALKRAVALEPRNASYQDLLCRFLLFDSQEAGAAVPHCKRATELNPYHSTYWLDLAMASYSTGAEAQQQEAILKAVSVDPTTPDVAWSAANFFLAQGKVPEALGQFAVVMRGDPEMVGRSLDLSWRTAHDVSAIQAILPPDPDAYLQFIRLLTAKNQWEGAQQVWSGLMQLNRGIEARKALIYVDGLIQQREVGRAKQVWEQLQSRSADLNGYSQADNLVVDGGFEGAILNAGFDWRYAEQSGIAISLDPTEFHSGGQSLLISYNGAGSDSGIFQYVPVKPNTHYTISAWANSDALDSANGPFISVWDAYSGKLYAQTEETLGTTAWHRLDGGFQSGPETELVVLRVTRDPGNTHVKGRFRVDDVSVRPTPPPLQQGK